MAFGSVQSVLVCVPAGSATAEQQVICPAQNGQFFVPQAVTAYLVDPGAGAQLEAATGPFDYGHAAGLWTLGFSMIVGLYVMSHGIGTVLGMLRRG